MNSPTSYHQIRQDLMNGSVTCADLVRHYTSQIQKRNGEINAFLEVFEQSAYAQAKAVDQSISEGRPGRLAGMIVGIKDLFCYRGHQMTCGSRILEDFESLITATPVQRLIDEGAIIIGRQNCDEFAMGSSNENSAYALTLNPHDLTTVPGGSSGGSAAAVAADMCMVSLGSDTGGSVRQPASFCGVVGLKPSYSRISRYGLTAYSSSFDTVGILAKTVQDCAMVLEVVAGADFNDSTCSRATVPEFSALSSSDEKYRIATIGEFVSAKGMSPAVKEKYERCVREASDRGHKVREVSFPYLDYLLPTYYILTAAEASANLSRYDGVRYGRRTADPENLETMYKRTRYQGFGKEVLRRIMLGTFVLSASYHDAFYKKAQKARQLIRRQTLEIMEDHDIILLPTTPTTAFEIGAKTDNPVEMYLSDLYTVQASVAGVPAISVPFGKNEQGLPIGIQAIAPAFAEDRLIKFSKELEEV